MLVGLSRRAARVAQKDVCMEEMMIRCRIEPSAYPFGEMGASQVPFVTRRNEFARRSESTEAACGNLINKDQLALFLSQRDELDMKWR